MSFEISLRLTCTIIFSEYLFIWAYILCKPSHCITFLSIFFLFDRKSRCITDGQMGYCTIHYHGDIYKIYNLSCLRVSKVFIEHHLLSTVSSTCQICFHPFILTFQLPAWFLQYSTVSRHVHLMVDLSTFHVYFKRKLLAISSFFPHGILYDNLFIAMKLSYFYHCCVFAFECSFHIYSSMYIRNDSAQALFPLSRVGYMHPNLPLRSILNGAL